MESQFHGPSRGTNPIAPNRQTRISFQWHRLGESELPLLLLRYPIHLDRDSPDIFLLDVRSQVEESEDLCHPGWRNLGVLGEGRLVGHLTSSEQFVAVDGQEDCREELLKTER